MSHPDHYRETFGCTCEGSRVERMVNWVVTHREHNHSAFNGYRHTWSDYSQVYCKKCGRIWRTKAQYVERVKDGWFD